MLVPGVIDSTTNFIEHPALVARRLKEFSGIVGKERFAVNRWCCVSSCLPGAGFRPVPIVALQPSGSTQPCIQTLSGQSWYYHNQEYVDHLTPNIYPGFNGGGSQAGGGGAGVTLHQPLLNECDKNTKFNCLFRSYSESGGPQGMAG